MKAHFWEDPSSEEKRGGPGRDVSQTMSQEVLLKVKDSSLVRTDPWKSGSAEARQESFVAFWENIMEPASQCPSLTIIMPRGLWVLQWRTHMDILENSLICRIRRILDFGSDIWWQKIVQIQPFVPWLWETPKVSVFIESWEKWQLEQGILGLRVSRLSGKKKKIISRDANTSHVNITAWLG